MSCTVSQVTSNKRAPERPQSAMHFLVSHPVGGRRLRRGHVYASGKNDVLSAAKAELATQVKEVFAANLRRYGSLRIQPELKAQGVYVGRFQVRSLMRRIELHAIASRRYVPRTTDEAAEWFPTVV